METRATKELVTHYYLKRWSSLNVKIIRIEQTLTETTNENTQNYLRAYAKELENHKTDEKTSLNNFYK